MVLHHFTIQVKLNYDTVISFVKRADVFLREMEKYLPKMYKRLMTVYQAVDTDEECEVIKEQYNEIDGISVDFGIMQKTRKAFVIKCEFVWDDIGTFAALSRFLSNLRGNNVLGNTFMEESENCSVFGKDRLIIVDAGDVILVMDKNKDQEIKYLVNELKEGSETEKYI